MKNYIIPSICAAICLLFYLSIQSYRSEVVRLENSVITLHSKIGYLDTVIQAQNDIIKDLRTDQYYISKDLDYLFPVVTRADSFLLKESGRGKNWRKVGRVSGYIVQGLREVL